MTTTNNVNGSNGTILDNATTTATGTTGAPKKRRPRLAAQSIVQVGGPPPNQKAPNTPAGFDSSAPLGRDANPWATLIGLAPQVAAEILAATGFTEDFGAKLVPKDIATALTIASAWRAQRTAAEAWVKYVQSQDGQAWRVAMRYMQRYRKAFEATELADENVGSRYPQSAEVFRARAASGTRGAQTKAGKKTATADKQAAVAQAVADTKAVATQKPVG